jgi:hypothetical protein
VTRKSAGDLAVPGAPGETTYGIGSLALGYVRELAGE